jgi:hypothetical protein
MFALLAFLCFLLALLGLSVGIDLVILGLAFVALHLMLGVSLTPWRR